MRNTCAVREGMTHRGALLPAGAELRPVLRDGRVVGQHAAISQHVNGCRRDTLAGREDVEEGVPVDLPTGRGIGDASPGVDHQLPFEVGGDLEPELSPVTDQRFQCLHDLPLSARPTARPEAAHPLTPAARG